jgi:hypothetical protein
MLSYLYIYDEGDVSSPLMDFFVQMEEGMSILLDTLSVVYEDQRD